MTEEFKVARHRASLEFVADTFDVEVATAGRFNDRGPAKFLTLDVGYLDETNTPVTVRQVDAGRIEEWEVQFTPRAITGFIRGRDQAARLLDTYMNQIYGPNQNVVTPLNCGQTTQTVSLPPPQSLGPAPASQIAKAACDLAGLTLLWQVRDYTVNSSFSATGRCVDVIKKLVEPWSLIAPFKVDVFLRGTTLVVRHRFPPPVPLDLPESSAYPPVPPVPFPDPPAEFTMTLAQARRTGLKLKVRLLTRIGQVTFRGSTTLSVSSTVVTYADRGTTTAAGSPPTTAATAGFTLTLSLSGPGGGGTFPATGAYHYVVVAYDVNGAVLAVSLDGVITVDDITKAVVVTWATIPKAVVYKIFRAPTSPVSSEATALLQTVAGATQLPAPPPSTLPFTQDFPDDASTFDVWGLPLTVSHTVYHYLMPDQVLAVSETQTWRIAFGERFLVHEEKLTNTYTATLPKPPTTPPWGALPTSPPPSTAPVITPPTYDANGQPTGPLWLVAQHVTRKEHVHTIFFDSRGGRFDNVFELVEEETGYAYDPACGWLLKQTTVATNQINPYKSTMTEVTYRMVQPLVTEQVTTRSTWNGTAWIIRQRETHMGAGYPPNGPGRSGTSSLGPSSTTIGTIAQTGTIAAGEPTAQALDYSNENLSLADLNFILTLAAAADNLYEWEAQFTGVAMPFLHTGDRLKLTGLVDHVGTPIPVPTMIITETETVADESKSRAELTMPILRAFGYTRVS